MPHIFRKSFFENIVSRPFIAAKIRQQLLLTSMAALAGAAVYKVFDLPFAPPFFSAVIASFLIHLLCFLFFSRLRFSHFFILTVANMIFAGIIIHATGGILSPYIVVLAAILISNISFGLGTSLDVPLVIVVYCAVILLEFTGVINQPVLSAQDIYSHWAGMAAFLFGTVIFLIMTGYLEKLIIGNLEERITLESAQKDKLREQVVEMNNIYHLGIMVSQVVHEICNPLTCIYGFIKLAAQSKNIDDNLKNDLSDAQAEIERLNNLIYRLRNFMKPGTGEHAGFSLGEVINSVTGILAMDADYRLVRFERKYNREVFMVNGSREEIQQVFFNLLKNSLEAILEVKKMRDDGCIEIELTEMGGVVNVVIRDNGVGMRPKELKEVATNFFTTKKSGLGLGMVIVKSILEAHKSELRISSEFGTGTEMSFTLPAAKPLN
ncbi:MAG: hypothetical protein A2219_02500 [Elusimicrobia bacterium RIFOXYA2_FULL_50_26]|nr:MAG: hypothetical protein A2219_02500 [Elusimicrobia bacterium RIFOXYA2_FULL_50_26]OGS23516.1 MAG: hypothetical protein A2314_05680 [Elusimicrobia bacterium RIFOXYB2_FULL_50_12]